MKEERREDFSQGTYVDKRIYSRNKRKRDGEPSTYLCTQELGNAAVAVSKTVLYETQSHEVPTHTSSTCPRE